MESLLFKKKHCFSRAHPGSFWSDSAGRVYQLTLAFTTLLRAPAPWAGEGVCPIWRSMHSCLLHAIHSKWKLYMGRPHHPHIAWPVRVRQSRRKTQQGLSCNKGNRLPAFQPSVGNGPNTSWLGLASISATESCTGQEALAKGKGRKARVKPVVKIINTKILNESY